MNQKFPLNRIAHEVLVEMELQSFSLIELKSLLSDKYKDSFNERQLYQHLYQQMHILYEHGYLNKSYLSEPNEIVFEVTDKFSAHDFYPAKSTKIFSNVHTKSSDKSFMRWVKNEHKKMLEDCDKLTKSIAEFERIMEIHPSHRRYIAAHHEEVGQLIKDYQPKIFALEKILSTNQS